MAKLTELQIEDKFVEALERMLIERKMEAINLFQNAFTVASAVFP